MVPAPPAAYILVGEAESSNASYLPLHASKRSGKGERAATGTPSFKEEPVLEEWVALRGRGRTKWAL